MNLASTLKILEVKEQNCDELVSVSSVCDEFDRIYIRGQKTLGEGGFSSVQKCVRIKDQRVLAVKEVRWLNNNYEE